MRVGLYGANGHQIWDSLAKCPDTELVAYAGMVNTTVPGWCQDQPSVKEYATLNELLADERVDLVSLCSPIRRHQASHAISCLMAGKHVYAEKPAAMTEEELDSILKVAVESNKHFREMAPTVYEEPYWTIRHLAKIGTIGTIVQVLVQKSYPLHKGRPQDEDIDGGLIMQNGIHAIRFVEHVTGLKVTNINAVQTQQGNFVDTGGLHIAASLAMSLEEGVVASAVVNYLNPPGFGQWGNESVRLFGTKGMMEVVDGGRRSRLIVENDDLGPIQPLGQSLDHFHEFVRLLEGKPQRLLPLEDELHPLRVVIRARHSAVTVH